MSNTTHFEDFYEPIACKELEAKAFIHELILLFVLLWSFLINSSFPYYLDAIMYTSQWSSNNDKSSLLFKLGTLVNYD